MVGGQWLDVILATSNVTTEGRADSILKGSHSSRAQWAHQVSAAALYILQTQAYEVYQRANTDTAQSSFEEWRVSMAQQHPQFYYWNKTLQLELLFLQFLKSQREANYLMYVECLGRLLPWMFAMDHIHYSRWLTVHVRDLVNLQNQCQSTYAEFLSGNFVTHNTSHRFSAMAHDQVHEQLNAMVKGDGGVIGITESETALRRWMVAGPETSRILIEHDEKYSTTRVYKTNHTNRHQAFSVSLQQM